MPDDKKQDTSSPGTLPGANREEAPPERQQYMPAFVRNNRFLSFIARVFPLFQFHPIMAHFPNGLIPASVFFLLLAIFFDLPCVELTAFYTLCAAVVLSPLTVITGIYSWKAHYKKAVTTRFMFKLYGGIAFVVLGSATIIWRLMTPGIVETGTGPYVVINLVLLVLAALLGHVGGSIVFAGRRQR
jgi:uncharacterized membrane protein